MLKFFQRIGLALVLALGLLACRQNPEQPTEPNIDLQDPAPDSSANRSSEEEDKQLSGFAGIRFDQSLEDIRRSRPGALIREDYYIVGEGERLPSATLYPDSDSSLMLVFASEARDTLQRIVVSGSDSGGSVYRLEGISIGSRLAEVQHINGRPFLMSGLGWDYPARAFDWQEGYLPSNLLLVFGAANQVSKTPEALRGDGMFSSQLESWDDLDMRVEEMVIMRPRD